MARKSSDQCDACRGDIGLWQSVFTSECAHTFHLRCVSGSATCPICAARWSNTPATAPAPAPATPFSFASPPPSSSGLFGDSLTQTSLFGQPGPSTTQNSSFSFSGAPTASPSSSLSVGSCLFGQQAPATPDSAVPATQTPSCPVCHVAMGRGQATVTSECNHTFHLRCISGSVCPVCSARWRHDVFTASSPSPWLHPFSLPPLATTFQPSNPFGPPPESVDMAPPVFNDDEPVETTSPLDGWEVVHEATNDGALVLKTHCEHAAVARDTARDTFAVLVHAKGPAVTAEASARASLDLVTVLDVSGSMCGSKLALLKQAMRFVIDHLGPGNRLSIVSFSSEAHRIIRLTRMSGDGKASAKAAVDSLVARGGTNIGGGLRVASEVLDGRRHRNAVDETATFARSYGERQHHQLAGSASNRPRRGCMPDRFEADAANELEAEPSCRRNSRGVREPSRPAVSPEKFRSPSDGIRLPCVKNPEGAAENSVCCPPARNFFPPSCGAPSPPGASPPFSSSSWTSVGGPVAAPQASTTLFGCVPTNSLFAGVPQAQQPASGRPAFGTVAPPPKFGSRFATPAMESMVESSRKEREQHQSDSTTKGGSLFNWKLAS